MEDESNVERAKRLEEEMLQKLINGEVFSGPPNKKKYKSYIYTNKGGVINLIFSDANYQKKIDNYYHCTGCDMKPGSVMFMEQKSAGNTKMVRHPCCVGLKEEMKRKTEKTTNQAADVEQVARNDKNEAGPVRLSAANSVQSVKKNTKTHASSNLLSIDMEFLTRALFEIMEIGDRKGAVNLNIIKENMPRQLTKESW